MPITLTNTTLSPTFTSAELDDNFEDLRAALELIEKNDLNERAGIETGQIVEPETALWVTLTAREEHLTALAGLTSGSILDVVMLPGLEKDAQYTARFANWACSDTGAGSAVIDVGHGTITPYSWEYDYIKQFTLANYAAPGDMNDGVLTSFVSPDVIFDADDGLALILGVSGTDGTALNTAGSFLSVTVSITRSLRTK